MRMKKVIITEGQYRLIKENDGFSYDTLAYMLLSKEKENAELAVSLIKSQDINIDSLVDEILKQKMGIVSIESLKSFIENLLYSGKSYAIFLDYYSTISFERSSFSIKTDYATKRTSYYDQNKEFLLKWSPEVELKFRVVCNRFTDKEIFFKYNQLDEKLPEIYKTIKYVWIDLIKQIKLEPIEEIDESYSLLKEDKSDNEYRNLISLAQSQDIDNVNTAIILSQIYDEDIQNEILGYWIKRYNYNYWIQRYKRTEIILNNSNIEILPETIGNLKNLTRLFVDSNKLTHIPESIGDLFFLKVLYLNDNYLDSLPENFENLKNLTDLFLNNNNFNEIPEVLKELTNLSYLDISGNQISEIPDFLLNMKNLKYLIIKNNNLPESEIAKLKQLNWMKIAY